MNRLLGVLLLSLALFMSAGCSLMDKNPVAPQSQTDTRQTESARRGGSSTVESVTYAWRASSIDMVWDGHEWDYLIVFKIPINYIPSYKKVYAINWYGGWGAPNVDLHHQALEGGSCVLKYLAGSRIISWYGKDPLKYYVEFRR